MGALANPEVGKFVNEYFVSAFQKVATFKIVNGQKQGGNVASYFCTPDGLVLDAVAGPVDGPTLLREARWVVETRNLALLDTQISEANGRLARSAGEGGPNFVQNAILGPLKDKRVATIDRISIAIGRVAAKPAGLDRLAPCGLNG